MPKKVAIFIDGAYLIRRIRALKNQIEKHDFKTDSTFLSNDVNGFEIWKYCQRHIDSNKNCELYRIFYYDATPLSEGGYHHPVSDKYVKFSESNMYQIQTALHDSIKETPNFALRLGQLKWNKGKWSVSDEKFKRILSGNMTVNELNDEDIKPSISQKGVDMKIGLDIASIAYKKLADVIILISGDSDLVPALKLARIEGLQVGIDPLHGKITKELREHVDFLTSHLDLPVEVVGRLPR